jgi:hypothetical protein
MSHIAQFFHAHWMSLAVGAYIVLSVLNRNLPPGPDGQKPVWLRVALDLVSFLPMPGGRGVFGPLNVPGAPSKMPERLELPEDRSQR